MSVDVNFRTTASAVGGREGHTFTNDGRLDLTLSTPKELGGPGGTGTNPEQLFAAGYSACFLSAMRAISQSVGLVVPGDASVAATVGIGPRTDGGFGLDVELVVILPGLDEAEARRLMDAAHQICPYSNCAAAITMAG